MFPNKQKLAWPEKDIHHSFFLIYLFLEQFCLGADGPPEGGVHPLEPVQQARLPGLLRTKQQHTW